MGLHHEAFKALNPVEWADVPQDDLKTYLDDIFTDAHTIVESVPSPSSGAAKPGASDGKSPAHGRTRSKTESAVQDKAIPGRLQTLAASEQSHQLQQEWKEVKINPKENPLEVKVYKLGSKDGRGAWFARRSLHEGLTFDQWKTGLEKEFLESMKVQGDPGSGAIRGIGADKRVEEFDVPDAGKAQVFQLSAQFPGPTSPRDFITLFLTSDFSHSTPERALRQFMIVSKPCVHPECPPRSGIIRGQYESVEIIREVPSEPAAAKRSYSSTDLGASEKPAISKSPASDIANGTGSPAPAIEWLMVTRSDPGGSVPRFMIEKGTPPGIVNDAGKFLDWVNQLTNGDTKATEPTIHQDSTTAPVEKPSVKPSVLPTEPAITSSVEKQEHENQHDAAWSTNGLYGMITGAFAAATSVVSGGLQKQTSLPDYDDVENSQDRKSLEEDLSSSETSSLRSFTSALEKTLSGPGAEPLTESAQGSQSEDKSQESQPQAKELKRLQERRRKLDEKAAKMVERLESKRTGDQEKDAAAMAKLREKHEKEIAKQEAKYKREVKRIEERRDQEERKAEEKRKKQTEREEKASAALELDRVKAERDIALKQVEMLKTQVGDLQAENTKLAARLGKAALLDGSDSASGSSARVEHGAPASVATPRVSS